MTGPGHVHVDVDRDGGVIVARVRGEVDLSNVEDVSSAIGRAVDHRTNGVVVDLSETGYLDSSAIRMLVELSRRLGARRKRIRVVVGQQALVRRVLSITRLHEVVPVDETVESAVAAIGQSGDAV